MLTLLHGDNTEFSRLELNRLVDQDRGAEIIRLYGRVLDETTLAQAIESSSLFDHQKLVVVENLFSKLGKKPKTIESMAKRMRSAESTCQIIVWEDKELTASILKNFGKETLVKLYKTPTLIFHFLDSLKPNETQKILALYLELTIKERAEIIFTMMVRRLRQLIMLADGVTPAGLQSWQASRLTSQAKFFTMNKLLYMYQKLIEIEYALKTGTTPFDLSHLVTQFILDF